MGFGGKGKAYVRGMRTTLTLSLLAAAGLCHVHAQTLQASMLPTSTVNLDLYTGDALGTEAAANGAGATWNFSGVTLNPTGIPLTFGPASQTPYAAQYPTAQYAQGIVFGPFQSYDYMQITGNKLELFVEGVPDDVNVYVNPQSVLEFPLSLGSSFTDTYEYGEGPLQTTITYAGNGTLQTSMGTYTNVVKLVDDEGYVIFWNTNPLYMLAQADDEGFFGLLHGGAGVGVSEHTAEAQPLLWPNPTTGLVQIKGVSGLVDWNLVDVLGRTILAGQDAIGDDQGIDVSTVPAGSYQLVVTKGTERWSMPLMRQ